MRINGEYCVGCESYIITCCKCKTASRRDSVIHDISVNISNIPVTVPTSGNNLKSNQLQELLNCMCYSREQLVDANRYECMTCNAKQDAVRETLLSVFPTVAFLPLMRYVYDNDSGMKRKLMTEVDYSNEIVLGEEVYVLVSVLYHKGKSAYCGHYVTEVLNWVTGEWYDHFAIAVYVW